MALSAILIVYNRGGEKQLILIKEQAKIVNAVLRAKALSIQGLGIIDGAEKYCGYGVKFDEDNGTFIIFKTKDCVAPFDSAQEITFKEDQLDERAKFSLLELNEVVFTFPYSTTVFDQPGENTRKIEVNTKDGLSSPVIVKINSAGQVSTSR